MILLDDDGKLWDKKRLADVARRPMGTRLPWRRPRPCPAPYDLRHSFASLLLAEARQPPYVARQLGHLLAVLLSTYAHLIDEHEDRECIDAGSGTDGGEV